MYILQVAMLLGNYKEFIVRLLQKKSIGVFSHSFASTFLKSNQPLKVIPRIRESCMFRPYKLRVTWRMRRETCRSICKLYSKTWSKTHAGSKHQQTGITQARQKVIIGQARVFDRRTISRGLEKRITWAIVQMRYKQSPNGESRVNPRYTGRNQKNRKQGNTKWLD